MERILIVRLGAMGDILHAIPAVVALQQARPQSRIYWMVEERWRDLLPRAVAPVPVNTRKWRKQMVSRDTLQALRALRREGSYDVAVDLQGSIKSAAFARLTKPKFLLGPADPRESPARLFYTAMLEASWSHVIDQACELAGAVSDVPLPALSRTNCDPFPIDAAAERWAAAQAKGRRFAILNPAAGWRAKEWPVRSYRELAERLSPRGFCVLINCGPGEEQIGNAVADNGKADVITASLTQLIALTRRAALFVGGDTGPMHLASMLGVPTVALFGPTDPARNGPYYARTVALRSPLSKTSYSHAHAPDPGLQSITVDEVMSAVEQVLR